MKLIKRIFILSLFCLSLMLFPFISHALNVENMPDPRLSGSWVLDQAQVLSAETETQLNQMISSIEAKNGTEIIVVTVPDTRSYPTTKDFTTRLFNHWEIGKVNVDNGVLFLFSLGDRKIEIETGYGIESILPDVQVGNIIDTHIVPYFREDDFDRGTLAGTRALIEVLEDVDYIFTFSVQDHIDFLIANEPLLLGLVILFYGVASLAFLYRSHLIVNTDEGFFLDAAGRSRVPGKLETIFTQAIFPTFSGVFIGIFALSLFVSTLIPAPAAYIILFFAALFIIGIWEIQYSQGKNVKYLPPSEVVGIILSTCVCILLLIPPILLMLFFAAIFSSKMRTFFGYQMLLVLLLVPAILQIYVSRAAIMPDLLIAVAVGIVTAYPITNWIIKLFRHNKFWVKSDNLLTIALDLKSVTNHLTEIEKVAQKMGSVRYEGWRSKQGEIHIRAYVNDQENFRECPNCQEYTLKGTKEISRKASYSRTGMALITFNCQCQHCNHSFTETEIIPRLTRSSDDDSYASGGSDTSGGGASSGGGGGADF